MDPCSCSWEDLDCFRSDFCCLSVDFRGADHPRHVVFDHLVSFFRCRCIFRWLPKIRIYLSFFPSVYLPFCLSFFLVLSLSDVSRFGHLHVFLSVFATSSYIAPFFLCFLSLHLCIFDFLVSFFSVSCRIITQSLRIVLCLSKCV